MDRSPWPDRLLPPQFAKVGVALVTGWTGHPAGTQAAAAGYDALTVSTEGGLEAVAEAKEDDSAGSVKPLLFKNVAAKGNAEFSSNRQQDAEEYFAHLLEVLTQAEEAGKQRLGTAGDGSDATASLFAFELEDRIECLESHRVSALFFHRVSVAGVSQSRCAWSLAEWVCLESQRVSVAGVSQGACAWSLRA